MTQMKTLSDGSEIKQDTFGSIFGGGQKKALDHPRKLKVDGQDFFFTIRNLSELQGLIDTYQTEHDRLLGDLRTASSEVNHLMEENAALKARIRFLERQVKVTSGKRPVGRPRKNPLPTVSLADPAAASKPRVRVQAYSQRSAA